MHKCRESGPRRELQERLLLLLLFLQLVSDPYQLWEQWERTLLLNPSSSSPTSGFGVHPSCFRTSTLVHAFFPPSLPPSLPSSSQFMQFCKASCCSYGLPDSLLFLKLQSENDFCNTSTKNRRVANLLPPARSSEMAMGIFYFFPVFVCSGSSGTKLERRPRSYSSVHISSTPTHDCKTAAT